MHETTDRQHVVFALTSHGFGHAARSLRVAGELLSRHPSLDLTIATRVPRWFVESRLPRPVKFREVCYEPGAAQINCFEVDVEGTRAAYDEFFRDRPSRLEDERRFLAETSPVGVVCDIPAVPIRAATELGIPVVGVSNFTWDWILEPILPREHIEALREDYRLGDLYLSLPFGPGTSPFRETEHVPLIAPGVARDRCEVLESIGLSDESDRPIVLVTIGGWGAAEWSPICVGGCEGYQFVLVGDLPVETHAPTVRLPDGLTDGLEVADLVAAVDLVLTKPGYGMASECVRHRTPMLGIERRDFREEGELLRGLRDAGPFETISLEDFFGGFWDRPLRELAANRSSWRETPLDGTREVARRLGEFFELNGERRESRNGSAATLDVGKGENR